MKSAAEQLASNINFNTFSKAKDLKRRLWFTLGALIVYRLGTYIPLPGIDASIMSQIISQKSGGLIGIFNKFSGGALGRMSVFALGIMPYISASIIMQLLTAVVPQLETLKKEGQYGQKKIKEYTRYLSVVIATVQSYGLAMMLEGGMETSPVIDGGFVFRFTTVTTIIGGTLFLMWLGEQITQRGIGNGISLIIFSGIVAGLPQAVIATLEMGRVEAYTSFFIFVLLLCVVALFMLVVFVERAQRRLTIQYPKRQQGNKIYGGQTTHLPIKLNSSGVIPPIFAYALLSLPMTISSFTASSTSSTAGWLNTILASLSQGKPLFLITFVALIIFFSFFYTAILFNPEETAENLKKNGGFIPGYRPGKMTSSYLEYVLTRLTVVGSVYLAVVCSLPEVAMTMYSIPFALGGTSILIVVSVSMDTVAQIQSHLLAHQYKGLIGRTKKRGSRK